MVFYLSINMTSDLKLYYLNDGFDNFNVKIVKYDNEESDIMTYFNNNKVLSDNDKNILDILKHEFQNEYDSYKIFYSEQKFDITNNFIPNQFCLIFLNNANIDITTSNSSDHLSIDVESGQFLFFENFSKFRIVFNTKTNFLMLYKKLKFKIKIKKSL